VADVTGWEPDVLPGYWQQPLALGADPDGEGDLVATLVSRGEPAHPPDRAVLAVHGYTDYFFHTELADHFAGRGLRFYALDLPKCGRSRRDGQTPHFTSDLAHYDGALEAARDAIGAADLLVYGHSAGGLIVSLWLDRLRSRGATGPIGGLVLNSPFFDLHGPAILRTPPTSAALIALARLRKMQVVRKPTPGGYGTSLHRDYSGEFDYNLEWKPVGGFPVTFGWINAIRRGQKRLHRGLDVTQIARWAGCVGNRLTVVPITDAKHDVFLSLAEPRSAAYHELDRWLDWYLRSGAPSTTPHSG
jgi:alpha-beta hydrolase superfamily lysophospholipase